MHHENRKSSAVSARTAGRFNELVLPHLDDAYGLARWLTGNRSDAEDVVQDACVRVLAALDNAVVEKPRAWLLAIVRNTAFSWLAKNRSKVVLFTSDEQAFENATAQVAVETNANPEAELIAAADGAALTTAVEALPLDFREVFIMRDVSGLTYREIAEAVGIPIGTVMSRLARARGLLINQLGKKSD